MRCILVGKISGQGSKHDNWLTACDSEMRIRSCGYHNARAFILQSLTQVRNRDEAVIHFQQNLGILATLLPRSSLKRILNYWTHRCWVSWNVHIVGHSALCMFEVLGAIGQDGLWVLIQPEKDGWEISSDFCVYFRLLTRTLRILCQSDRSF